MQTDLSFVAAPRGPRRRLRDPIRRHPTIVIGGVLLGLIGLMAVLAPYLGTTDPQALSPLQRLRWPSPEHWFGTDMLGRDVYSRTVYGARVSLTVGLSVALLSTAIGLLIGLITGFNRWADMILMRIMDGLMAIPAVLIAIALMALTRASLENVILAITIAEAPRVARLVRGVVLTLRDLPLCRGSDCQWSQSAAFTMATYRTQHAATDFRTGDLHRSLGNAGRGDPVLSRCRHAAHHSKLGQYHG